MIPLEFIEIKANNTANSSIIWLHGLGADGHDFESLAEDLQLPEEIRMQFLIPHAPVQPVSINGGFPMRSWFDIFGLEAQSKQDELGIRKSQQLIDELIDKVIRSGIPSERIIIGGFSQGGALALHIAIRYPQKLAGVIGLSTFLPLADLATAERQPVNAHLPVLLAHGTADMVVPYQFGQTSLKHLQDLGHPVTWKDYPIGHSVCAEEMTDISQWIQKVIT